MSKNYMNDSQASEIVKYISDTMKFPIMGAGGGFAPIGTINSYMGTVAPIGWLVCDGTVYNIADYPDLATHIASQFGSTNFFGGDGTTTFGVPDLRGEFLRGSGTNSHTNQGSGANVGVHQDGTEHLNVYGRNSSSPDNWIGVATNDSSTKAGVNAVASNRDSKVIDTNTLMFSVQTSRQVVSQQSELEVYSPYTSRPTNTSVLFIIKATLSDAEINAFNVYTPREHQVAWWEEEIDGVWKRKPRYSKTYTLNAFAPIDISDINAERIDIMSATVYQSTFSAPIYYTSASDWWNMFVNYSDNGHTTLNIRGAGGASSSFVKAEVTVEYTKTTDDWQTS